MSQLTDGIVAVALMVANMAVVAAEICCDLEMQPIKMMAGTTTIAIANW